jgi:predicted MFS family arabinose efflux permease
VPRARGGIHQRDRKAGPSGLPEGRLRTHETNVTVFAVKTVTQRWTRGIGRLMAAAFAARLADQGAALGVVLVVLGRTHSPPLAGLVVGAFSFPALITGPVIGAWLDRLRAKRALFAANQAILTACLIAIDLLAGRSPGGVLAMFGLVAGLTGPVITGGFSSLVPLLVPPDSLTLANVADSATYDLSGLAGPAMVALAASLMGPGGGLAVVAGVSATGVVLALMAPMPRTPGSRPDETAARAIADGMRILVRRPLLAAATAATTTAQLPEGMLPVVLPLLAVAAGSRASASGWLLTAASVGGLIGTAVSGRLIDALGPRVVIAGATAAAAPLLAVLAVVPPFVPSVALMALFGMTTGPLLTATFTVRQREVPAGRYAQLAATAASAKTGASAVGAALAGLMAAAVGVRTTLLCAAAVQLAAATPMILPLAQASRRESRQPQFPEQAAPDRP